MLAIPGLSTTCKLQWLGGGAIPVVIRSRGSCGDRYPALWAQTNRIAADGSNAAEVRFFSRSAAAISPRYSPLMWMGDQLVTFDAFDGLASAIRGMMSYGFSGFSLAHSDVRMGGQRMLPTAGAAGLTGHPLVWLADRRLHDDQPVAPQVPAHQRAPPALDGVFGVLGCCVPHSSRKSSVSVLAVQLG